MVDGVSHILQPVGTVSPKWSLIYTMTLDPRGIKTLITCLDSVDEPYIPERDRYDNEHAPNLLGRGRRRKNPYKKQPVQENSRC